MVAPKLKQIENLAEQILSRDPDPVVRFRLLRDVLKIPHDDNRLIQARKAMLNSPQVEELKYEQRDDGSWGRFHTRDCSSKQKIAITEIGVYRGVSLGLTVKDPVFRTTLRYLKRLAARTIPFPDPAEVNDRWATGVQLIVAATTAQLQPLLPEIDDIWEIWADIATRTFISGRYEPEAEVRAHKQLAGASVRGSYLVLHSRYSLSLLGSRAMKLSGDIEKSLFNWIWHREDGVKYFNVPMSTRSFNAGSMDRWFNSLELLSVFPSWRVYAGDVIDWIWKQRNDSGLWDFGPRASFYLSYYMPLSDSWKKRECRQNDWSTRVLALMKKYYETE